MHVCNAESERWLPFYLNLDAVNSYSRLQPSFFSTQKAKTTFTLRFIMPLHVMLTHTVAERAVKFTTSTSNFVIYLKQPQCCSVKITQRYIFSCHRVLGSSLKPEILTVWGAWRDTLHEPHQHRAECPGIIIQVTSRNLALTGWRLEKLWLIFRLDHSVPISCGAQQVTWSSGLFPWQ